MREVGGFARGHEAVQLLRVCRDRFGCGRHAVGKCGEALVDEDRAERDSGAVFDRERGVDRLAHRRLFRHRHEHDLTPRRILEQRHDVGGLLADRPDAHRVEQPAGREQERDRVAGRGCVHDDQIGRATFFERLDLAEHEDVLHARHRGRDDIERAGRREPLRDAPHPVGFEVFEERGVRRQEPGPDPFGEVGFVVAERVDAEHRGQPRFALDLDNQHPETGARRGDRERGCHGCLPDAALARDDHDVGGGAELRNLHLLHATRALMPISAARRIRMLLALVLVVLGGALALPAAAQDVTADAPNGIDVVQVDGLLDPPNVALVESSVRAAEKNHSTVLVIQLAGTGRGRRERGQARRRRCERDRPDRRVDRTFRRGCTRRERPARARRADRVGRAGRGDRTGAPAAVRRARQPAARRSCVRCAPRRLRTIGAPRAWTRSWTAGCRRARRTVSGS